MGDRPAKKSHDPRMHTAEHILNQTMVRMFACGRCFSAHIEKKKSKCDYRFDRPLEDQELRRLENRVNAIISDDLPVVEEWMSPEAAQKRYNLERLPDKGIDSIRIVKIGDYDACPCIGPHVNCTSQIGRFRITTSSFQDAILRIRFRLDAVST